jgi:hypothetical protein
MDPFILNIITICIIALGTWAGVILIGMGKIMYTARKRRGSMRTTDLLLFSATAIWTLIAFVLVFIWPGLLYMIPSTVAFLGIASIPILGYLSEFTLKHLTRMRQTSLQEVDEHATI